MYKEASGFRPGPRERETLPLVDEGTRHSPWTPSSVLFMARHVVDAHWNPPFLLVTWHPMTLRALSARPDAKVGAPIDSHGRGLHSFTSQPKLSRV